MVVLSVHAQAPPIGGWRDHLSYHRAIAVATAGDRLYCATPYALFSVDPTDKSMTRLSKSNGLSETGIAAISFDPQLETLTAAYTNSNIDVVKGNQTYNIPVIRDVTLTADKTIHDAYTDGGMTYLSSGLGIFVIDEARHEIRDTYVIGTDGDTVGVWSVVRAGQYFYAATSEGLKRASAVGADLADYHNWEIQGLYNGLGVGDCRQVVSLGDRILVLKNDSVFAQNDDEGWSLFYSGDWKVNDMRVSEQRVMLCQQSGDSGRVLVLNGTGGIERVLAGGLRRPLQALFYNDAIWVADSVNGLSSWGGNGSEPEWYIPNSPLSVGSGDMAVATDAMWEAAGSLSRLEGGDWTNYPDSGLQAIAIGRDSSVWAGAADGTGLLRWQPGDRITHFDAGPIGGLTVDADGNLWITNTGAGQELSVRQPDGSMHSFTIPFVHAGNAVSQVLADDNKQLWIVSPGGNGVFCYNEGASVADASDDQWKYYRVGTGQGHLPDNNVNCLAKDKSGFIWVGTANGVGVIQCAYNAFKAGGCDAVWPVVQLDNFAGYLFSGEAVQAIAVDGADRKWIGTRNGVWLFSPDVQKVVYHFTADSTPLLSNDVRKIVVDPRSGEVFFMTAKGLCSFRGTATAGGETNSNVLVFPNPVSPAFTGTIAIRGLVDGAIVKIVEMNGRLVYQTNALGGQAIWDGKDDRGRRAVSGVYLVLVSDLQRGEKTAAKIVFIGK